jgi:hypothetical protein
MATDPHWSKRWAIVPVGAAFVTVDLDQQQRREPRHPT